MGATQPQARPQGGSGCCKTTPGYQPFPSNYSGRTAIGDTEEGEGEGEEEEESTPRVGRPGGTTPSEVELWEGQGLGTEAHKYFPPCQEVKTPQMDPGSSESSPA